MNKRTSASARIFAALALIAAFVLAALVLGGALGGGSDGSGERRQGRQASQRAEPRKRVPAIYEIESGDTLVAIAHRTGVPVARIEMLNPQVDPQILIAGETLKLR